MHELAQQLHDYTDHLRLLLFDVIISNDPNESYQRYDSSPIYASGKDLLRDLLEILRRSMLR